jgi:hypothetical protein
MLLLLLLLLLLLHPLILAQLHLLSARRFPPRRRLLAERTPPYPSWRRRIRSVHADDDVMDLDAAAEAASKCMLRLEHARTEEREDGFPSPRASPSSFLAASIDDDDVDDGCPRWLPPRRLTKQGQFTSPGNDEPSIKRHRF